MELDPLILLAVEQEFLVIGPEDHVLRAATDVLDCVEEGEISVGLGQDLSFGILLLRASVDKGHEEECCHDGEKGGGQHLAF